MDIAKPIPSNIPAEWPSSRTMTIVLGKNNKAICYLGEANVAKMQVVDLSAIQQQLLSNKSLIANSHSDERGKRMLVIVKPTSSAVYKNFVDMIDEINIAGIETYAIDDKNILTIEQDLMRTEGLLTDKST